MPLRLAAEVFDPVDVVMPVGEFLFVVDPLVVEPRGVEHVVADPAVAIGHAVWAHLAQDKWCQRGAFDVRDNLGMDLVAALQQPENRGFSDRTRTALALVVAAEIALVNLDLTFDQSRVLLGQLRRDDHL